MEAVKTLESWSKKLTTGVASPPRARSAHTRSIIFEFTIHQLQDGLAAGQTIPHVHFHISPRKTQGGRFQSDGDAVYPARGKIETELHAGLQQVAETPQSGMASVFL